MEWFQGKLLSVIPVILHQHAVEGGHATRRGKPLHHALLCVSLRSQCSVAAQFYFRHDFAAQYGDNRVSDGLRLVSLEHVKGGMLYRLGKGQERDDLHVQQSRTVSPMPVSPVDIDAKSSLCLNLNTCGGCAQSVDNAGSLKNVAQSLRKLVEMSDSKYSEIQRDVAAALYSLSINEANKVAFTEIRDDAGRAAGVEVLPIIVKMAKSKDLDTMRNMTGVIYRLSMCPQLKRRFVKFGVLKPLLNLARSKERDVKRYAVAALKELCESAANRTDMLEANALPSLFELTRNTDSRVRALSIWTLEALSEGAVNREKMIDGGALPRVLLLLLHNDVQLRRGAAICLHRLSISEHRTPDHHREELTKPDTLKSVVLALKPSKDMPLDSAMFSALLLTIKTLKGAGVKKVVIKCGGLGYLWAHARVLGSIDSKEPVIGETKQLLHETLSTLLFLMKSLSGIIGTFERGNMNTLLQLCKHHDKKARRQAAKILSRLSTVPESKTRMVEDPPCMTLLMTMMRHHDDHIRFTAAKIIAELAEEPTNRRLCPGDAMHGVLEPLKHLALEGDTDVQFEVARALADFAEAVDNRKMIAYGALDEIVHMLQVRQDDIGLVTQIMRLLANLCAPPSLVAGEPAGGSGRYGALVHEEQGGEEEALEYDNEDEEGAAEGELGDMEAMTPEDREKRLAVQRKLRRALMLTHADNLERAKKPTKHKRGPSSYSMQHVSWQAVQRISSENGEPIVVSRSPRGHATAHQPLGAERRARENRQT